MDARHFFGMAPVGDSLHWRLPVVPELTTPANFLFGGCGLGACLAALEEATGRTTVWATAQYLSFAPAGDVLDLEVTLAAEGRRVTQGRVVGTVGDREILTVNAAVGGPGSLAMDKVWATMPTVPDADDCPLRSLPNFDSPTIFDQVEVRLATGWSFEEIATGKATEGLAHSALWARVPGQLEPSAAMLAIFGDYLTGAVSQAVGERVMSRSLDNTLRVIQLEPTAWVLCDNRIDSVVDGHAQGSAYLWSERGTLLAVASQSMSVRRWEV